MNHFEYVRKCLSKGRPVPLEWDVKNTGAHVSYTASFPGLIACQVHIPEEQLIHGREKGQVRRNSLVVQVALSKQVTEDQYRVHMNLSRPRRGHVYLRTTKLYPLGNLRPNIAYAIGQGYEDLIADFRENFPAIARYFHGLEAALHQPLFNLVNLMKTNPKPRHILSRHVRNYYANQQQNNEFLFFVSGLDFKYGFC